MTVKNKVHTDDYIASLRAFVQSPTYSSFKILTSSGDPPSICMDTPALRHMRCRCCPSYNPPWDAITISDDLGGSCLLVDDIYLATEEQYETHQGEVLLRIIKLLAIIDEYEESSGGQL